MQINFTARVNIHLERIINFSPFLACLSISALLTLPVKGYDSAFIRDQTGFRKLHSEINDQF